MPDRTGQRGGQLARLNPRVRRLVLGWLVLAVTQIALIVVRFAEFATGAAPGIQDATGAVMGVLALALIGVALRNLVVNRQIRREREAEAARRQKEADVRWEFLRLRAPNPAPGQCPVCAFDDLDDLAERDRYIEAEGTPSARVTAYGPDQAHAECAAAVPYAPPPQATTGGTRQSTPAPGVDEHCAEVPASGGRRAFCLAHNEGDPRCTVYPRHASRAVASRGGYIAGDVGVADMGPLPEVLLRPAVERPAWWRCSHCGASQPATDETAAEKLLRDHSRCCLVRLGVTLRRRPPDGWRPVAEVRFLYDPAMWEDAGAPGTFGRDIAVRTSGFDRFALVGAMLLFVNGDGVVCDAGYSMATTEISADGPDVVRLHLEQRLTVIQAAGNGVWASGWGT